MVSVLRAKYGLHAVRHFCISLWTEAGFSRKKVQTLAEHSSIMQTLDTTDTCSNVTTAITQRCGRFGNKCWGASA